MLEPESVGAMISAAEMWVSSLEPHSLCGRPRSVHWSQCRDNVIDAGGMSPRPGSDQTASGSALPSATSLGWFHTAACSRSFQTNAQNPSIPRRALTSNLVSMAHCPAARLGAQSACLLGPHYSHICLAFLPPSFPLSQPPTHPSPPRSPPWSSSRPPVLP